MLVLTARSDVDDKVGALDYGADDYLVKPFDFRELEARCRALLRRPHGMAASEVAFGDLVFDGAAKRVTVAGQPVELGSREFRLLELLLANLNRVLSKDALLDQLFGLEDAVAPNADRALRLAAAAQARGLGRQDPHASGDWATSPSWRHRVDGWSLQRRLLGGLLCVLALLAAGLYFLLAGYAARAADRAFDQLLLASALSIAESIQVDGSAIGVDLPYASLALLATGRRDRIFYRDRRPRRQPDHRLPGPRGPVAARDLEQPRFVDTDYLGAPVRAWPCSAGSSPMPAGRWVTVVVAHTRDERRALAAEIFANAFLPVLLVVAGGRRPDLVRRAPRPGAAA